MNGQTVLYTLYQITDIEVRTWILMNLHYNETQRQSHFTCPSYLKLKCQTGESVMNFGGVSVKIRNVKGETFIKDSVCRTV